MPFNLGVIIIKSTAWVAVALFLAALAAMAGSRASGNNPTRGRRFWTYGCVLYLIHVLAAFQGFYGWSHEAAYEVTAQFTYDVVRVRWGGGVYANYLFTLVWLADAVWWWVNPVARARRPAWLEGLLLSFMVLMIFFGAVVFAHNPLRWLVLLGFMAVALHAWRSRWIVNRQPGGILS